MTTHFPDYYQDFKCIASSCKHTCCAGWEIDVDETSLERFLKVPSIAQHIKDGTIVLGEDERCPFLREDGLCTMILEHGEDFLCDICTEHPRFYNDFEDHTEGGLGLVCEEACRIILTKPEDFTIVPPMELPYDIQTVFDSTRTLTERLSELKDTVMPSLTRASFINTLEVMDTAWTEAIDRIIADPPTLIEEQNIINNDARRFSNFCAYLLYRYPDETGFAVESTYLLADLVIRGTDILEAARMFSGEVEYSDINIDKAIDEFS
jgi:lysine-N-methylase